MRPLRYAHLTDRDEPGIGLMSKIGEDDYPAGFMSAQVIESSWRELDLSGCCCVWSVWPNAIIVRKLKNTLYNYRWQLPLIVVYSCPGRVVAQLFKNVVVQDN